MAFLDLSTEIQYLKGVGPKLGSLLGKKGIRTVRDLLEVYPRAYEDRRAGRTISSLIVGDLVALRVQVLNVSSIPLGKSHRKIYDIVVRDSTGQIHCKFFRIPYKGYFERFRPGQDVQVIGKVIEYRGRKEFHHPEIKENPNEGEIKDEILPIYVETEGLSSAKINKLVRLAIEQIHENLATNPKISQQIEKLPESIRKEQNLIGRLKAIELLHNPPINELPRYLSQNSDSHRRIIFEEFFWLELFLILKKAGFKKQNSYVLNGHQEKMDAFIKGLPFSLTRAQLNAFNDIEHDLASGEPMSRLVQGDVGSGKTLVVFLSVLKVFYCGYQSCLMVPTEILAEQHFNNAQKYFAQTGLKVGLLTGRTKNSERLKMQEALNMGDLHFLIGTHALIEEHVQFKKLALAAIDEQHRFGVEQRAKLKGKGVSPHFLILTATPIPRTLAMTAYGDLDISVINEMPAGRAPIQTRVTYDSKKNLVWNFMEEQIKKGRQVYIIYPLVEESEKIDLKNAVDEFELLVKKFPQYRIGLLHGKMKSEEKEKIMNEFRFHNIDILVSTTVIEVGVDVSNANLIIIEHAERFGLSQLHQLRGRVGRGAHKSYCVLVLGHAVSDESRQRTQFLETTSDGFKVAEFDLELRGPGEFLGSRQSGLPGFKLANLVRDVEQLLLARKVAASIVSKDPKLEKPDHLLLKKELLDTHGLLSFAGIG